MKDTGWELPGPQEVPAGLAITSLEYYNLAAMFAASLPPDTASSALLRDFIHDKVFGSRAESVQT